MVLGLIDFLLGGKKKTKVPKNAQVSSPGSNGASSYGMGASAVPNGSDVPTQNASAQQPQATEGLQFQDAAKDAGNNNAAQAQNAQAQQFQASASAGTSDSLGGGALQRRFQRS